MSDVIQHTHIHIITGFSPSFEPLGGLEPPTHALRRDFGGYFSVSYNAYYKNVTDLLPL